MIDFHSHILPKLDDGSGGTDESRAMLERLYAQRISAVAATPHFYPAHQSISEFLERRQISYEHLQAKLPERAPEILLGAETLYYAGCSRMKELEKLCIRGTKLLLLEMPSGPWSSYMVQELIDLSCSSEWMLLLAHIERYLPEQKDKTWDTLLERGILMQANADFFIPFSTRRKAVRMLQEGRIHLLGTDCHNLADRPPRMDTALRNIRKYGGSDCLRALKDRSDYYLDDHAPSAERSFADLFT